MDGLIGAAFPLLGLVGLAVMLRPVPGGQGTHGTGTVDLHPLPRAEAACANPRRRRHPAS